MDGTRRVVPRVGVVLLGGCLRWYGSLVKTYPPLYGGRVTLPPCGGRHLGAGVGWVAVVRCVTYILNTVHECVWLWGSCGAADKKG